MVQHWWVYLLQLLLAGCIGLMLIFFRWGIQKKFPPRSAIQKPNPPVSQSFRFHYHLGFALSFVFLIIAMLILPLVQVLGKSGISPEMRSRSFFSLLIGCFFLLLGISYGVKKGDFKWKRSE